MNPSPPELKAIVKKLQELWQESGEDQNEYLLRELEALIYRYRESQQ